MPGMTPPVRDPNALLLHPDYSGFGAKGETKPNIFPEYCIRQGHGRDLQRGHIVSRSTLKLIADPKGRVIVLETSYDDTGAAYTPTANHWPLHEGRAAYALRHGQLRGWRGQRQRSADLPLCPPGSKAARLWRNIHHVIWRMELFNNKLRKFAPAPDKESSGSDSEFAKKMPGVLGLQAVNEHIAELARACLPSQPEDPVPAGTPLEHDGHFRHFTRIYYDTKFKVAVSTEVVLQHNNDPATRTLAFINVMPQKAGPDTDWHTAAVLSLPLPPAVPSIWQDILDNSAHSDNFSEPAHQLLISNLATRSPDGVCFAPAHFDALSRETGIWEAGILPNLLANPLPGLTLPVVNITGHDLSGLANCSFNLFA